ncbi:uncharacterized protein ACH125_005414 isoform 4-T4 [Urocitellus parryii]
MKKEPSATQGKKSTKLSRKTTAKLSTSAKRIQKELAEITLNPLLTTVILILKMTCGQLPELTKLARTIQGWESDPADWPRHCGRNSL